MIVATATISSVPTSAGAMPPPDSPNSAGPFVKKSQLSAPTARLPTDQTTMASAAIASAAATNALLSATRLASSRRRDLPVALRLTSGVLISRRPSAGTRTA
jgi:hypothetical protein